MHTILGTVSQRTTTHRLDVLHHPHLLHPVIYGSSPLVVIMKTRQVLDHAGGTAILAGHDCVAEVALRSLALRPNLEVLPHERPPLPPPFLASMFHPCHAARFSC